MGCNCSDKKKDSSVKQPLWRKVAAKKQRNKDSKDAN